VPILPPALDDRGFDDLVEEVLSRVPAHTPEWTNPRPGDPGRTLVELFAWLADTMLYRANLIPARQRLAFLRLLGMGMRPAVPARGLVTVAWDDPGQTGPAVLRPLARLKAAVPFETRGELTVLPVTAEAYVKRIPTPDEQKSADAVLGDLHTLYGLRSDETAVAYVTSAVFAGGAADPAGVDLAQGTVDGCLWLALLAARPELVPAVRDTLGGAGNAPQRVLSVGAAPSQEVPGLTEEIGPRGEAHVVWEMSTGETVERQPQYVQLDVVEDGTRGLRSRGVVRLALPGPQQIGAPDDDVRNNLDAGLGDAPPRLDVPETAARLVAWLRVRPTTLLDSLPLAWVGVNAVEVDARVTVRGRVVGTSDGTADQEMPLGATSVEAETLVLQVEESGAGYREWHRTDDLATAGRDDAAYMLDAEAGTVRFGDGVRGRIPDLGRRVRVDLMRAGGGAGGNLAPGSIGKITATDVAGATVTRLTVVQPLATDGGEDAETLDAAERRIPAAFVHRNRAVTEDDYRRLAAETPGVRVGRVEVLPRFKPHQRISGVPGVVTVMALPYREARHAPNPRPDRFFREQVHAHLDAVRPIATELYVIGCEYVPLGVSTSFTVRDGFGRDATVNAVRDALRAYLWSLAPGGPSGDGWPLGGTVRDRELEVVVARVAGVFSVAGVNLFARQGDAWANLRTATGAAVEMTLKPWQLPELLAIKATVDEPQPPPTLDGLPNPFAGRTGAGTGGPGTGGTGTGGTGTETGGSGSAPPRGVAVPVVPDVC
jgi:predicted phage baseplate assembly protein